MGLPILKNTIHNVIRSGGFRGFNTSLARGYKTYRGFLVPPMRLPTTEAEAVQSVHRQLDLAKGARFFMPTKDRVNIISGCEFALNGKFNSATERMEFSAKNKMPKDYYTAIAVMVQDYMRSLPEGSVYCPGTMAIDTGKMLGDKRVGENRGFIISSGPEGDIVEFTKKNSDPLDEWADDTITVGDGPMLFEAKDFLGDGRSAFIVVAVCADYSKELASGKITFPIRPDLILSPSAGFPAVPPPETMDVVVNDAIHNPFSDVLNLLQTRAWEPTIEQPVLSKFLTALGEGQGVGASLFTAMHLTLLKSEHFADYLSPKRILSPLPYTLTKFGDEFAVDTGERSLPPIVTNDGVARVTAAVATDGATVVSNGIGVSDIDKYGDMLKQLTTDLPWSFAQRKMDEAIAEEVARQVEALGLDLSQQAADIYAKLNQEALQQAAVSSMADFVMSGVDATSGFQSISTAIGNENATGLATTVLAQPLVDAIAKPVSGESYLQATIMATILSARQHDLAQHATVLQQELVKAQLRVDVTSGEIARKKADLVDITSKLDTDPTNDDLQAQKAQLEQEVEELETQFAKNQADEIASQQDVDSNQTAQDDSAREEREERAAREARAPDVFHSAV
jgi:hypothetical protein